MVGNLDNVSGNLKQLSQVMEQAAEFECNVRESLTGSLAANDVAAEYAEKVHSDWDHPNFYHLVIWEPQEGVQPELFQVKINVRYSPEFYDGYAQELDPAAPKELIW